MERGSIPQPENNFEEASGRLLIRLHATIMWERRISQRVCRKKAYLYDFNTSL